MVYLARRDNLVFPPPDVIVPLGQRPGAGPGSRQDPALAEERGDTVAGSGEPTLAPLAVDTTATPDSTRQAVDPEAAQQPVEPEKPKKARDPNWDRLREPRPGPRP
jgi:hypothetical protein